jgi:hypothetical protein
VNSVVVKSFGSAPSFTKSFAPPMRHYYRLLLAYSVALCSICVCAGLESSSRRFSPISLLLASSSSATPTKERRPSSKQDNTKKKRVKKLKKKIKRKRKSKEQSNSEVLPSPNSSTSVALDGSVTSALTPKKKRTKKRMKRRKAQKNVGQEPTSGVTIPRRTKQDLDDDEDVVVRPIAKTKKKTRRTLRAFTKTISSGFGIDDVAAKAKQVGKVEHPTFAGVGNMRSDSDRTGLLTNTSETIEDDGLLCGRKSQPVSEDATEPLDSGGPLAFETFAQGKLFPSLHFVERISSEGEGLEKVEDTFEENDDPRPQLPLADALTVSDPVVYNLVADAKLAVDETIAAACSGIEGCDSLFTPRNDSSTLHERKDPADNDDGNKDDIDGLTNTEISVITRDSLDYENQWIDVSSATDKSLDNESVDPACDETKTSRDDTKGNDDDEGGSSATGEISQSREGEAKLPVIDEPQTIDETISENHQEFQIHVSEKTKDLDEHDELDDQSDKHLDEPLSETLSVKSDGVVEISSDTASLPCNGVEENLFGSADAVNEQPALITCKNGTSFGNVKKQHDHTLSQDRREIIKGFHADEAESNSDLEPVTIELPKPMLNATASLLNLKVLAPVALKRHTQNELIVSAVTWNLAEASPSEDESKFIQGLCKGNAEQSLGSSDLVLVAGQECENIKPRRSEGHRSREFRRLIIQMVGKQYVPIALHMLGGIQFALFCKRKIIGNVKFAALSDVTCGIGNVFHNKGAIGCFVTMSTKPNAPPLRLLFVCAHMVRRDFGRAI